MPRGAVLFRREVFDGYHVQRIQRCDFAIGIQDGQGMASNQDELRVGHGVFESVRSPQGERPEAPLQPLSNALHIHRLRLRVLLMKVNARDQVGRGRGAS